MEERESSRELAGGGTDLSHQRGLRLSIAPTLTSYGTAPQPPTQPAAPLASTLIIFLSLCSWRAGERRLELAPTSHLPPSRDFFISLTSDTQLRTLELLQDLLQNS